MIDDKWIIAAKLESAGQYGTVGVHISVSLPRELTERDKSTLSRLAQEAHNSLLEESQRLDPEHHKEIVKERADIVALFPKPIFIQEIPNEYCSQWCCKDRPWFIVTTEIGPIKIGWRKRVLVIDWSESTVANTADDLFPNEDTTKYRYIIHAWGYDKAREYIQALLGVTP